MNLAVAYHITAAGVHRPGSATRAHRAARAPLAAWSSWWMRAQVTAVGPPVPAGPSGFPSGVALPVTAAMFAVAGVG
jgi:hypothetical protein